MKLTALKASLSAHPETTIRFVLPDGTMTPAHAHVTEVARVEKKFIDCGGKLHHDVHCRLQVWWAADHDHRLLSAKLARILDLASGVLDGEDMEVDVEHETVVITQQTLAGTSIEGTEMHLRLAARHTGCLAEDLCIRPATSSQSIQFKTKRNS